MKNDYFIITEIITRTHKVYVNPETTEDEALAVLQEDGFEDGFHRVINESTDWIVTDSDSDF